MKNELQAGTTEKQRTTADDSTSASVAASPMLPAAILRNDQYHEFVLGQIVRPYQGMLWFEKRIENMRYVPFGKNETTINYFELQNYTWENEKWFETVISRLSKIYKQCDYSFFPNGDFFANTLKQKMIESGIKDVSVFR